ncbi:DUF551 domain-containing protein [Leclercia sp. W17]|nr:DUF551 domain-containing protein [Leclercia sp. W17]
MEMARQLLASMEQEPVAWRWRWSDDAEGCWRYTEENRETRGSVTAQPLYAAPQLPQPAVPDESAIFEAAIDICRKSDAIDEYAWNRGVLAVMSAFRACSAAMLQGAEPAQGWIPCSERIPTEIGRYWCYVEEQNSLGKSHYQWNCSWNGDRWWVESENGGRVTHWMPLPNQPKE